MYDEDFIPADPMGPDALAALPLDPFDHIAPAATTSDASASSSGSTARPFTDLGNAERLADAYGADFRWVSSFGHFLTWNGRRWTVDQDGAVMRFACATVRAIPDEARDDEDDNRRRNCYKHAVSSEQASKLAAMVKLSQSLPGMSLSTDRLDADSWLLSVNNGTLDLRSGCLREHDRGDLITKLAPVRYDAHAKCPTWLAFLNRTFGGDQALIDFMQRAIGYSLTGSTREQVMFIPWGPGGSGKTTVSKVVHQLLGELAMETPTETLMERQSGSATNDIARLRGARVISAVETDEGKRMHESMIKRMTGGDKMTARYLYGEFFEFDLTGKIWLTTNHRPTVRGNDHAIWRRLLLIPFSFTVQKADWDLSLDAKLTAELPGILAWAVRGCLDWQAQGLNVPAAVANSTQEYREEQDSFGEFLGERCVVEAARRVGATELYEAYKLWAHDAGEFVLPQRLFGTRLGDRGFAKRRRSPDNRKEYLGIGLNSAAARRTF